MRNDIRSVSINNIGAWSSITTHTPAANMQATSTEANWQGLQHPSQQARIVDSRALHV